MGWFRNSQSDAELKEASTALSAMFSPHHAALPAPSSTELSKAATASSGSKAAPQPVHITVAKESSGTSNSSNSSNSSSTRQGWWNRLFGRHDSANGALSKDWRDIPPSPIQGYEVGPSGLTDVLATPPHTLSSREVRDLVVSLSGIEETARYAMDVDFPVQMGSRGRRGMELLVNPVLLFTGLYLMTWKTATLYSSATPRQSVFLTKLLALARAPLPTARKEQIARRHRRLLQATNLRVLLTFLSGATVTAIAWVTMPPLDVIDHGPEVEIAKQTIAYHQFSEQSLRWLWYVYYHHPVYVKDARTLMQPATKCRNGEV